MVTKVSRGLVGWWMSEAEAVFVLFFLFCEAQIAQAANLRISARKK